MTLLADRGVTGPAAMPDTTRLLVRGLRLAADRVLELELADPAGEPLPEWEPGAHVDVLLADGLVRQYSLCGDPADRSVWRLAVLREEAGRGGSAYVHTVLRPGDVVEVRGPRNNFPLVPAEHYLFVAGGIGITPILPMVARAAASGATFRVVYGGRSRVSMAFLGELAGYGDRVDVVPQDERGLLDVAGELAACPAGTAVYCCGPEPLIAAVEAAGADLPPGSLHRERFAAAPPTEDAEPGAEFEVELASSGEVLTVGPDQSVLEALEEAGVPVLSSCREGICGTCETGVLSGTPEHRDLLLSDEEKAEGNTMLVCVSRACSRRLVLDL
jgi:ferredoxin-NADP reductase